MTKWDLQQELKTTSTFKTQSVWFTQWTDSERKEIGGNHGPFEKVGEIDGGRGDRNSNSENRTTTTIIPQDNLLSVEGSTAVARLTLVTGNRWRC